MSRRPRRRSGTSASGVPVLTVRDRAILNDLQRGQPVDRTKPGVARAIKKYAKVLLAEHRAHQAATHRLDRGKAMRR
jgi:hypothetical protein